jgi:ferritin
VKRRSDVEIPIELLRFPQEQADEEKSARNIVHKFQLVKIDPAALLDLDRDLDAQ